MRALVSFVMVCGLGMSAGGAEAETLSGAALAAKLSNSNVVLSKNGRKSRRRLEFTLRKDGTGGSLHVPSGQMLPVTWTVKNSDLCLTQQDGREFCMSAEVEGDKIEVQMNTGTKMRTLKGTISPL